MSLIVLAMVKTEDKVAKGNTAVYEEACVRESVIGVNTTSTGNAESVAGKVEWDESMIPLVLSSFFWGYMSTQNHRRKVGRTVWLQESVWFCLQRVRYKITVCNSYKIQI